MCTEKGAHKECIGCVDRRETRETQWGEGDGETNMRLTHLKGADK